MSGIIFDLDEKIVSSYAWGLGRKTKNEAELIALFFGMNLLRKLNITKIMVFGDSKQVIQKMNNESSRGIVKTIRIYKCIQ